MNNWEIYIYELMDEMVNGSLEEITNIRKEIDTAFKFGFIDEETRVYLKEYVYDKAHEIIYKNDMIHRQNMYDIEQRQNKIREQQEIARLLCQADDEYKAKYVRRGRKRTAPVCLYYKNEL